jgi:hypothetical protein
MFRGLKLEFNYLCPSPNLHRKLSLALAFTVFGLVACTSGAALLVADYDPDPRSGFALASLQSSSHETATVVATTEMLAAETVLLQMVTKAEGIKSCRRKASNDVGANCDSDAARTPGVVDVVTDPPARAEVPTGPSNEPAIGAPERAVLVSTTPPRNEATPEATDAAPPSLAQAPAPEGSATKPQRTARQQSRRRSPYENSPLWAFDQLFRGSGYARQRPRTLFW